uniref:Anillin, actin binding protein 2 n=1 Tax=Astyanax mexicanus TaxID=7994 RepID=W5K9L5_ASTMX
MEKNGQPDQNQKRQRDPLEENVSVPNELESVLKRRRLAADGVENQKPLAGSPSRSRRFELEVKPDTPALASVRLRVQQLTQRRDGERNLVLTVYRFKTPTPESSPVLSTPSARTLSNLVHNMQQQLNATVTPSTKEASRIRQARDDELKLLKVQPLTENMWLKRSLSDSSLAEVKSATHTNEEMSTSALIDKMFEDVLQEADKEEEEEKEKEHSLPEPKKQEKTDTGSSETKEVNDKSLASVSEGNSVCIEEESEETSLHAEGLNGKGIISSEGDKLDEEMVCGHSEETEESTHMCNEEDFLTLPPSCILSPLSKSVEAAVTPLRMTTTLPPPTVQSTSSEEMTSVNSAPPLYSIDAYRSQQKNSNLPSESMTSGVQRQAPDKSYIKPAINTKETIKALSEEAAKLQTVINQTLQALSCCSDEEHGKGSLQEAEAEKLLLVSSEKHTALLAEISRLREGKGAELNSNAGSLQPCRGTVSISSVQLPLKVEFVCSARTGRPTHYFFILIRYGSYNIVATPLATAADAENGDTITFPTSITLQDIRSSFEIDVEVYSLSNNVGNTLTANLQQQRSSTKSRVTPRKLLTSALPALGPRRTSNFCLVGSHKITLASLGQSKFTLDKMKFEGKIRRLLGDEFQEKVSPCLTFTFSFLHSVSFSQTCDLGFCIHTMFEDVSGFGAWQRLFFKLEGGFFFYWNHPNEMGDKPAEGSISLCGFDCVKPVERDSCARPNTFELVNVKTLQQDGHVLTKTWFSADNREERANWMDKLNQVLLDLHTWSRQSSLSDVDPANISSNTATSRESIL